MSESAERCVEPSMTDEEYGAVVKALRRAYERATDPNDPMRAEAAFVYELGRAVVEREYLRRSEGVGNA